MISLISALIMLFILSVFAATMLFALIRITQPHKRKIYKHQTVKHGSDPLPYQLDNYGTEHADQDALPSPLLANLQASAAQDLAWANKHADKCAESREQNRRDTLKTAMNSISSDIWKARINRPDGFIGAEYSSEDK